MSLVLVVMMYMLEPSEGSLTFDFICYGSLKLHSFTL
jgi:hypothetical protein